MAKNLINRITLCTITVSYTFTSVNILIDEGVHHYVFIASYLSTNIKL